MNYMTAGEMARVLATMNFINAAEKIGEDKDPVGFEVRCYDCNGETLGVIKYGDAPEYTFYPEKEG